jgi:hypothetical protein
MPISTNPAPHPKSIQDIAAEFVIAALHGRNDIQINEIGGKSVSEFYKAILEGLRR